MAQNTRSTVPRSLPDRPVQHFILPGESPADFERFRILWHSEFAPTDAYLHELVECAAEADWRRDRYRRALLVYEQRLFLREPDPSQWTAEEIKHLARLQRYVTSATKIVDQLRRTINTQLHSRYRLVCAQYRAGVALGHLRAAWARYAEKMSATKDEPEISDEDFDDTTDDRAIE